MSEILLAKPILPPGFIDCSVGEAYVVREALSSIFDTECHLPTVDRMYEYPLPNGYPALVKRLEEKHGAPVVITNGAKQALGATFYALKKMGKSEIGMRTPYWALIPPLANMHGMACGNDFDCTYDSYLCVAPNNPDGAMCGLESASLARKCKIPFVHDAAYFSHVYLPMDYQLKTIGDVQIYSASKSFGLSGLRLGYAVCPNPEMYRYIQEYMEHMTVGVSILPQMFLDRLLDQMDRRPDLTQEFEATAYDALQRSKKLIQQVDPQVLEVPGNLPDIAGMFGWFKVGAKADFQKAKINVIDGALFGVPGYIRMNLALNVQKIEEIVFRLNSAGEEK